MRAPGAARQGQARQDEQGWLRSSLDWSHCGCFEAMVLRCVSALGKGGPCWPPLKPRKSGEALTTGNPLHVYPTAQTHSAQNGSPGLTTAVFSSHQTAQFRAVQPAQLCSPRGAQRPQSSRCTGPCAGPPFCVGSRGGHAGLVWGGGWVCGTRAPRSQAAQCHCELARPSTARSAAARTLAGPALFRGPHDN